jgi:hypothetical protein
MGKENIEDFHSSASSKYLRWFWSRDNKDAVACFRTLNLPPAVLSFGRYSVENRLIGLGLGLQNLNKASFVFEPII